MHEAVSCEFLITGLCNLRCDYCIAQDLPQVAMDDAAGRAAVDLFVHLATGAKTVEFTFTGGEPLTAFSTLSTLTEYASTLARNAGMTPAFIIKTNGTILGSDILEYLHRHAVKVVLSIDGMRDVHDKHRITGAEEKTHSDVCTHLAELLESGIPTVASVTVSPSECATIGDAVRFLHSLGCNRVDIGPTYGTTKWTEDQIAEFRSSLLNAASYVRHVADLGGDLDVGPFYRESEHVEGILADRWGCHAAASHLAFLPDGRISGCSALAMLADDFPELILGDVFEGLQQKAIDRMVSLAQAPREARDGCAACAVGGDCTGGCLAINYATTGRPLSPPPIYCETISVLPAAHQKAWRGEETNPK